MALNHINPEFCMNFLTLPSLTDQTAIKIYINDCLYFSNVIMFVTKRRDVNGLHYDTTALNLLAPEFGI